MTAQLTAHLFENQQEFLGFLERRLSDRALAEDILQDAFLKSLEKGEEVRSEESSVAWFYRLLRNAVIDHYRRAGTRNRALELLAREMQDAVEPPPDLRGPICGCVSRIAASLKPEYAAAIQRVEIDGVAVQQFAHEAGITPNNASVRVFRAREALRKQVKTTCGSCAEHGCVDCSCHG
jgi:RNA polymerase sigma-70 factor (ECF subfamily)